MVQSILCKVVYVLLYGIVLCTVQTVHRRRYRLYHHPELASLRMPAALAIAIQFFSAVKKCEPHHEVPREAAKCDIELDNDFNEPLNSLYNDFNESLNSLFRYWTFLIELVNWLTPME